MTLCASLWLKPGSLKELSSRLDKSEYGVYLLLKLVRDKKWIYQKGEIYYCYKKTVIDILNPNGYELDLKEPHHNEFRKQYIKHQRKFM